MRQGRGAVAVGVLARAPVPGACKTRLAPLLGNAGAARVQHALIERALALTCAAAPGAVTLFTTGDAPAAPWSAWQARFGVAVQAQASGNLGARMHAALEHLLGQADRALLIGTDAPALTPADLHAAARALHRARMVFQPAEDGGYVLVGARELHGAAFRDIPWSTGQVMARTRRALAAAGWQPGGDWLELPQSFDVDRPADLRRAVAAGLLPASLLDGASRPDERADIPLSEGLWN